jgi:tRNA dimethylallyltransferase
LTKPLGEHGQPRRLALVGPTASGKSAAACAVAVELGGVEILAADSMSVYRGMDVGTAKPMAAERTAVPHHLLDLAEPGESFTLAHFQEAARDVIADVERRGSRPLVVGGTGLYVQAIVDDLTIPGQWPDARAEVEAEPDTAALHRRLLALDPVAAGRMEPTNRRRIVRALEVTIGSGRPFSSFGPGIDAYPPTRFDLVGLRMEPAVLKARIEARVQAQLASGFLEEVQRLARRPRPLSRTASQALGYRELLAHLHGEVPLEEAVEAIVLRTRRLARRQMAWFRRDPRITWLDLDDPTAAVPILTERWRLWP